MKKLFINKEIKKKYVVLFISLSSCWYPLFGIYPFGHISVDLPDILQTIFHSLHSFSSYKCIEDSCNQSFQNLNSFKKHMNTKHLNNLLINEIETPKYISNSPLNFTNLPTYKISTDNELFCNTSQSLPNNSSIPFDLNATSNLVYKSAVEFTLNPMLLLEFKLNKPNNVLSHFIQGKLWKQKITNFQNKTNKKVYQSQHLKAICIMHVHFILAIMLGDNLEFSKSFSASVYKESLLNKILSFHVTSNYFVDVMHDVFEEYLKLFSLETLNRRKSNFDYGTIEYSGPPRHYWCFRFEAKHKELKLYAHATTSRKNITLTLAKKFAYSLIQQPIPSIMLKEKDIVVSKHSVFTLSSLVTKKLITTCLHEIIEIIIIHNEEKVKLLTQQIKVEYFHPHYESYIVDCSKIISMQNFNDLTYFHSFPINISQLANGQSLIRAKDRYLSEKSKSQISTKMQNINNDVNSFHHQDCGYIFPNTVSQTTFPTMNVQSHDESNIATMIVSESETNTLSKYSISDVQLQLSEEDSSDVKQLLMSWNLNDIIDTCLKEMIDISILKSMSQSQSEKLLSSFPYGIQLKFWNCLKTWQNTFNVDNTNCSERQIADNIPDTSVLNDCSQGKLIVDYFKNHGKLNDACRNILVEIIIAYMVRHEKPMSIKVAQDISLQIIGAFPTEIKN
ncbi:Uncharacterized protein FWK35_00018846 [Aphis craccivora]|uniref:C2H2-type domain-containing protein n=1 Tax=Aphis craccivora TaxID=307492 RepID=A0A6G0WXM7_APHCR|nr:Uncharacterized protein FWK35_00018846 [Aphis craccivora]